MVQDGCRAFGYRVAHQFWTTAWPFGSGMQASKQSWTGAAQSNPEVGKDAEGRVQTKKIIESTRKGFQISRRFQLVCIQTDLLFLRRISLCMCARLGIVFQVCIWGLDGRRLNMDLDAGCQIIARLPLKPTWKCTTIESPRSKPRPTHDLMHRGSAATDAHWHQETQDPLSLPP